MTACNGTFAAAGIFVCPGTLDKPLVTVDNVSGSPNHGTFCVRPSVQAANGGLGSEPRALRNCHSRNILQIVLDFDAPPASQESFDFLGNGPTDFQNQPAPRF